jgi:hypothetical protein
MEVRKTLPNSMFFHTMFRGKYFTSKRVQRSIMVECPEKIRSKQLPK